MRRSSFADMNCTIAKSLEMIGEWWSMLIIRDAFLGVSRFEDFQQRLGVARNVLTTRLDKLVDEEILERRCYDEARGRHDYVLTRKGRALWPVLTTLRQWGDDWTVEKGEQPVVMHHKACNHDTTAKLHCAHCGQRLAGADIRLRPGPGADEDQLVRSSSPTR